MQMILNLILEVNNKKNTILGHLKPLVGIKKLMFRKNEIAPKIVQSK